MWKIRNIYKFTFVSLLSTGYGFVDFDSPTAAEVAVQALQSQGIQAQMAKVQFEFESLVILTNHNKASAFWPMTDKDYWKV